MKSYDELLNENQSLAAQVEYRDKEIEKIKAVTMRLAEQSGVLASVSEQLKVFCKNLVAGNIPEFHKAEALRQALGYEDGLIKQHLAEIRAQAVLDAVVSHEIKYGNSQFGRHLREYADSIRREKK